MCIKGGLSATYYALSLFPKDAWLQRQFPQRYSRLTYNEPGNLQKNSLLDAGRLVDEEDFWGWLLCNRLVRKRSKKGLGSTVRKAEEEAGGGKTNARRKSRGQTHRERTEGGNVTQKNDGSIAHKQTHTQSPSGSTCDIKSSTNQDGTISVLKRRGKRKSAASHPPSSSQVSGQQSHQTIFAAFASQTK